MNPIEIHVVISLDEKTGTLIQALINCAAKAAVAQVVEEPLKAPEATGAPKTGKSPDSAQTSPQKPASDEEGTIPEAETPSVNLESFLNEAPTKPAEEVKPITDVEARQAINKARERGVSNAQMKALLSEYGATKVTDLAGAKLTEFLNKIEKLKPEGK